ncbi:MAG: DoxX family protein [Candidatus Aceula meridiana]|nr:DoxX family protein [Candidatus Aceula meridiana]
MKNKIAFIILRASLGIVFLIFGIGKFTGDYWARSMEAMPVVQAMPWPAQYSVWGLGAVETLTALLLISGLWLRPAAIAAALQLAAILIALQFQEIRDIALLGVAVFLAFNPKSNN